MANVEREKVLCKVKELESIQKKCLRNTEELIFS